MKKSLYLLAFLSFWSYFTISIAGLNAKYDQLFIILIFCVLVVYRIFSGRGIYVDRAGFFLIVLCLISLFSSYFNAPDPAYSLRQTVNLFSVSLAYFIFPNVLTSYEDLSDFIKVLLRIAMIWLILSAFLFLFSYATDTPVFGVTLAQNEAEAFGVYATMVEPNIFGSFMLVIFFFAFSSYMSDTAIKGMAKVELRNVFIMSLVGIFISFTRGVWLAAIIGIGTYYILNSKNMVKTMRQVAFLTVAGMMLLYIAGEVLEIGFVKYKITNFFSTEQGTGQTRLALWGIALSNWIQEGHFYMGTGTFSFATFLDTTGGYDQDTNVWISNVYIMFLHDTGLIGLLTFLFFYGRLTFLTLRTGLYKRLDEYRFIKDFSMGLFLALLGIGIAFFFTTALTTSNPWILFGIVSAFSRINRKTLRESPVNEH